MTGVKVSDLRAFFVLARSLASQLGLVQSYADASVNYYYQDGSYYVIVPPAGALVEELPYFEVLGQLN